MIGTAELISPVEAGADLYEPRAHVLGWQRRIDKQARDFIAQQPRAGSGACGIKRVLRIDQLLGERGAELAQYLRHPQRPVAESSSSDDSTEEVAGDVKLSTLARFAAALGFGSASGSSRSLDHSLRHHTAIAHGPPQIWSLPPPRST